MYFENGCALKQYLSLTKRSSYQKYFLELEKLLKKDNILVSFSKMLTYFCDPEELWYEPGSLTFK